MPQPTTTREAGAARLGLIWPAQGLAFAALVGLFELMPRRWALDLSAGLVGAVGPWLTKHNESLARNLAVAFPDLPVSQRDVIVGQIWRNFGRVLADYAHFHRYLRAHSTPIIEVSGYHHLKAAAEAGPCLLVGAHYGNWELTGAYPSSRGLKVDALYTPRENPWVDRQIQTRRVRATKDATLIPKWEVRQIFETLRRGRTVFLLADHRVRGGKWVPFFGRPAETTATPARMARRFACPIVPGRAEQLPGGRYRLSYYEPLRPDLSRDAEADVMAMTTALNDLFESWIRERPDQWTCFKRRWRKKRKVPVAQPAAARPKTPARD